VKLLQKHGALEHMPGEIRNTIGEVDDIRQIYQHPGVTDSYDVAFSERDCGAVVDFLGARVSSRRSA
jgi:hypothetical protein